MTTRRYNWKRSPFDAQDAAYAYQLTHAAIPRKPMLPAPCIGLAYAQEQEGSCTANALARVLRSLFPGSDPSRQFIYDMERAIEGTPLTRDSGAFGRDGAKVLHKFGVCPEAVFPYTHSNMLHMPSAMAMQSALPFRISGYQHLYSVQGILDCLAASMQADGVHAFIPFGFEVPESFESDEVARTGVVPMPVPGEKFVGGHEVFICGADVDAKVFYVANAWGDPWGMRLTLSDGVERGGFCTMPFAFIASRKLCDDFITLRK